MSLNRNNYLQLSGNCRCGTNALEYATAIRDYYGCCSPWQDRTTGKVIGYGWDFRADPTTPPGSKQKPIKTRKPGIEPNPVLSEIGPAPRGMTTCLYERFDAEGVHIYAGITDAPRSRASIHLAKSTWTQFAVTGRETWFESRREAKDAERAVIKIHRPVFNRQHAHLEARNDLILYLVRHERFDLLEVTATWG